MSYLGEVVRQLDKPVERPGIDAPGSGEDLDRVIAVALPELRRRARSLMRGEKAGHLLQPTALVSEAFVRLFRGKSIPWDDPAALIIAASNAMGQALVDHARWQRARSGWVISPSRCQTRSSATR